MSFAYRHKLIAALDSIKSEGSEEAGLSPIAWGCELAAEDDGPTSFTLKSDNLIIAVPVYKKDLKLLEDLAEPVQINSWQIEWQIRGTEIINCSPSSFFPNFPSELISLALDHLKGLDMSSDLIEANLSHLSLYRAVETSDDVEYDGDQYINKRARCDSEKYPGSFGTLILQIPVVGGHRGGEFRLHNRTHQSETFITSRNSQKSYHLTVFYDDCQETVEPITKGSRLEFVYNLRHKEAANGVTQSLVHDPSNPLYRIWQQPTPALTSESMAQISKKQATFKNLLTCWSIPTHNRVELYVIPLDHTYTKTGLSFCSLKGVDRLTANLIASLIGDFVEIHLATVTKYIGYKETDWIASGRERLKNKNCIRHIDQFKERMWTEHYAGNWVDRRGRQLSLPPVFISVPDELLGLDELVFQPSLLDDLEDAKFDGHVFERAALVIWPRNQTFSTALCFGLDQVLDVVESGLENQLEIIESMKTQMRYLMAYCKHNPNKAWLASTTKCSDLRCEGARYVSREVGYERALRLINLCLRCNWPEVSVELLRVLFININQVDFRCHKCSSSDAIIYVGGICSNLVADGLATLIQTLGWNSTEVQTTMKQAVQGSMFFDLKQTGQLAYFTSCLFHRQCFGAASHISDHVFRIMTDLFLKEPIENRASEEAVAVCIDMLCLIDGLPYSEQSRLNQLLSQLKALSIEHSSTVIGWLQQVNTDLLKSLSSYWEFYMELVTNLESQLSKFVSSPLTSLPSLTKLEKSAAQLMTTYLRLDDKAMLNTLIEKVSFSKSSEARNLLAALISSRWIWAMPSSPLVETTLANLSAARVQQLIRFKFPMFKWEQPDAVLKEHPIVEAFLHSREEFLTYDNFASEEEAKDFVVKFFHGNCISMGYSATVVNIGTGAVGKAFVDIRKTTKIYESSLNQLEILETILGGSGCSPVTSLKSTPPNTPLSSAAHLKTPMSDVVQSKSEFTYNKRAYSQSARVNSNPPNPPKKRSKRLSLRNEVNETQDLVSVVQIRT